VDLAELEGEPLDHRPEAAHQPGHGRSEHRHELGLERVAGREPRDRVDLLGRQRLAVHGSALEIEQPVLAAERGDRLRCDRGVAVGKRERRRALEQLLERLRPGLVRRPRREAVLHDAERRVGLAEALAQLDGLCHGQAAVVDREDRTGRADLARYLVDDRRFLVSVHLMLGGVSNERARSGGLGGSAASRPPPGRACLGLTPRWARPPRVSGVDCCSWRLRLARPPRRRRPAPPPP
jgi:hypothetical protein